MSKFKVGDKIIRTGGSHYHGQKILGVGDIVTVHKCNASMSSITLKGYDNSSFFEENFELYIEEKTVNKFKRGDKVVRIDHDYRNTIVGGVYTVRDVRDNLDTEIYLDGCPGDSYAMEHFKLQEDTSKHHKHHDLIIAWAKGAEIEWFSDAGWLSISDPIWREWKRYRIKPTESPEQIEKDAIVEEMQKLQERLDKLAVK